MSYRDFIPKDVQEQLALDPPIADREPDADDPREGYGGGMLYPGIPDDRPSMSPGAWGTCTCGHAIYDHSRRAGQTGGVEFAGCRLAHCDCTLWHASDGSLWPTGEAGKR